MNISGILILIDPAKQEETLRCLESFPRLEIHSAFDDGKVVAVLEGDSTAEEVNAVKELNLMDGVVSATMVYHNFEEEVEGLAG